MNAIEYCLLHGLKLAGPYHPAILCAQESLSYGALTARVSQFAAGLREAGVRPSNRVGMLMLDTPDLIALHLGAIAAGAIAVAMSSRASAAELAQILAIVRPAAVVVDAEFAAVAAGAVAASSPNTRLMRRDRELVAWKAIPATTLAPVRRQLDDPAFWVMTSGTTGRPKAVEHRHSNVGICAQYYERVLGCTRMDRLFATSRFHFAYAIGNMFAALRIGASNILLERWATTPSVAETVERFKPTVMLSVPAVYHRLLDAGLAPTPAFRALRHYVSAGERLPPQIWSAWEADSGHPILDGLGCSELVYMVIGNTPQRRRPGSSGLAMPSVELRIVDEAGTILAEPGKTGRLEVRMPSVCAGYRATTSQATHRISRKNAFGPTAGLPPATSIYRTRTASIITAAAPVICCGCPESGSRRPRSKMRWPASVRSANLRPCWAKAKSGLRRSRSISFRRRAPTAPLRWRPRANGCRGRCRPTSGRGGSKLPTICRAQRPARSSATSFASNCGAIRIDALRFARLFS
jgi:acyl-coenzyme A synthetase/AMP-(fatty) acid ligase